MGNYHDDVGPDNPIRNAEFVPSSFPRDSHYLPQLGCFCRMEGVLPLGDLLDPQLPSLVHRSDLILLERVQVQAQRNQKIE